MEEQKRLITRNSGLPRKFLICNKASAHYQKRFAEVLEDVGLTPYVEYVVQINSGLNGRESYPDRIDDLDINAAVKAVRALGAHPDDLKPAIGAFYDYEPWYRNIFGRKQHWSSRTKYTSDDIAFMEEVRRQLRDVGLPMSQYGIPRTPKGKPMDYFRFLGLKTSADIVSLWEWVQLNFYPNHRTDGSISARSEKKHRAAIQQNIDVYLKLFQGKPVVPTMYARYAGVDNSRFFSIYLDEIGKSKEIDTIMYWTNTHSDVMFDVYTRELRKVAQPMLKWAQGAV